jgi:hypothetical protein
LHLNINLLHLGIVPLFAPALAQYNEDNYDYDSANSSNYSSRRVSCFYAVI